MQHASQTKSLNDKICSIILLHFFSPCMKMSICDLSFLKINLFLFSFISDNQSAMLNHFLNHYKNVGVSTQHMHFVIHNNSGNTDKIFKIFKHHHILNIDVLNDAVFDDVVKMQHVNKFMLKLPMEAWLINPDIDEFFFSAPCPDIREQLEKNLFLCGVMQDRLSHTGNITKLNDYPDISSQYPIKCNVRQYMKKFKVSKVMIVKPSRKFQFKNPHSLNTTKSCKRIGKFAHYTMTLQQMQNAREKYRLQNIPNSTLVCGHKANGVCKDYQIILDFMKERIKSPMPLPQSCIHVAASRGSGSWTAILRRWWMARRVGLYE